MPLRTQFPNAAIAAPSNARSWQSNGLIAWWPSSFGFANQAFTDYGHYRLTGDPSGSAGTFAWGTNGPTGPYITYGTGGATYWTMVDANDVLALASFTYAFWFKSVTTDNLVIIEKGGNAGLSIQTGSATVWVIQINSSNNQPSIAAGLNDGAWHHVVITYNAAFNLNVYNNGANVYSTTNGSAPSYGTGASLCVGARAGAIAPFIGSLADVRIYNYAMSAQQAAALYGIPDRFDLHRSVMLIQRSDTGTPPVIPPGLGPAENFMPIASAAQAAMMR